MMQLKRLNVPLINKKIKEHGFLRSWVITQIGEKPNFGYVLLREGLLPKDQKRLDRIVKRLSDLLEVSSSEMIVTLKG